MKRYLLLLNILILTLSGCATYTESQLNSAIESAYQAGYDSGYNESGKNSVAPATITATAAPVETKGITSRGTPIIEEDDSLDFEMNYISRSTAISEIGYDYFAEVLLITFKDSGASYYYYDVPYEVYDELLYADSIGRYYNSYVKGNYDCVKLD